MTRRTDTRPTGHASERTHAARRARGRGIYYRRAGRRSPYVTRNFRSLRGASSRTYDVESSTRAAPARATRVTASVAATHSEED